MPTDDLDRFLLPQSRVPPLQAAGRRQPLGLRPLRQGHHRLCTATPARPASPSSRGRPCSTPNCRTTRSWRSSRISPRAAASARRHAWWGSTRTRSRDWPCWPDSTPRLPTMTSWLFPPETREVQFDEKWSFVYKKEKNCDPRIPRTPTMATTGTTWPTIPSTSWSWK